MTDHDPNQGAGGSKGPPGRARGRELALWILCHLESHPGEERDAVELFWREPPTLETGDEFIGPIAAELRALLDDGVAGRWARRLTQAYVNDMISVDAAIELASKRWRLERMDRVDRNLLRLCAVELRAEKTPRNVVVAEVVRLAARYGGDRSPTFVNGLAEALAQALRDVTPPEPEPEPEDPGAVT
ncbi:Transcription termination protein NusB [Enhygromyxa salina]|uniref:Transcription termination protein NusB n=1 Tax=Enhygromyxa salina TaxID=215803 RepID=A0A0C1ZQB4_9BACT|nr:transcription antitermination factor NusB [Enhygromyxa salina]KIG13173.1 Transcription termination protein NusB [Enhygromyxa salina]